MKRINALVLYSILSTSLSCLAASLTPSQILDLSSWALTLPVDSSNTIVGAAATIDASDLMGGYSSSYFYSSGDKKVAFYNPSNGASTSPGGGSDHTRCELRELYNGDNVVGNHEWLSSTGGTLRGSVAIGNVSINSSQITFSQIHGTKSDVFVLLVYRPSKKQVELKIYDYPGASTAKNIVVATDVNLGSRIDYILSFKGSKVSATVNGITTVANVQSAWLSEPVHFAAGAYHSAPNSGNPSGDASKDYFYSLSISHL